jgi:CTP synthase (UTP-ammonia lyase)
VAVRTTGWSRPQETAFVLRVEHAGDPMKRALRIGLVGDFKPGYRGHIATDDSLRHGARAAGVDVENVWLSTVTLESAVTDRELEAFDGLFLTPGTPYESLAGALRALRFARERGWPLLATCGGFQHLLLEFAIGPGGVEDGQHGDYSPTGGTPVIVRVACPAPNRAPGAAALSGRIRVAIASTSHAFEIYKRASVEEEFACNWELNPELRPTLEKAGLRMVGFDSNGQVRIAELPGHPFFLGTLFQPQLSSTLAKPHPIIQAFCATVQQFRENTRDAVPTARR